MAFSFGARSKRNLVGVHPMLSAVARRALEFGVMDFSVISGDRTQAEQDRLYTQGRTEPGPIVTWTMNSRHLIQADGFSHAFDFAVYIGGKLTWEERYYDEVGKHMVRVARDLNIPVTWGGDFRKRKDRPHFQWEGS